MRPVILLALAFSAGILLGQGSLYFPLSIAALIALGILIAGILLHSGRTTRRSLLLIASGLAAGMALLLLEAAYVPPHHYRNIPFIDGYSHRIAGTVSSPLDRDPGRIAFTLAVDSIDGSSATGTVRIVVRDELFPGGYGDRIELSGRPVPPRGYRNPGGFDYPAYLARQGVYAVVPVRSGSAIAMLERGSGLFRFVQDLRDRIRRSMTVSLHGDGAAVLLAMTIGEEGTLTDDLRERFMAAGVTHIISISGSHLGMVAIICFWLTRNALFLLPERAYHGFTIRADPRKVAALLAVLPVVFYAFLAGGQVATIRALVMILAGLAALSLDRDSDLWSALAIAALISLVPAPQALFDISFQLSYLSVLSIAFVVSAWNSLAPPSRSRLQRLRNSVLLLFVISLTAALATGPLVAFYFRQVSFAGLIANMVVVPAAGALVVPLGLISGILSLVTGSFPLAAENQFMADRFVGFVSFFSRMPFAAVHVPSPDFLFAAGYAGLLASTALWARARLFSVYRPLESPSRPARFTRVVQALSAVLLVLSLLLPLFRHPAARATFIDAGQGDCSLIETVEGAVILIDGGGTRDNRFDVGRRVIAPYLRDRGIRTIDLVILSHPHPDHMNGLLAVLKEFTVRAMWGSGLDTDLPGYAELQEIIGQKRIAFRTVSAGHHAAVHDAQIAVLHPGPAFRQRSKKAYAAENDRSLVVTVALAGRVLLFPGDIHREGEQALLRNSPKPACDLIKVPHHGSKTSSSEDLVAALHPAVAVFTVGEGNPYRHPAEEVVERYRKHGSALFRTDRDGAVMVRIEPAGLTAQAWSDLELRRISRERRTDWWMIERENWRRVAVRTAGI
ncbi:MAG: DNA internalization-related competence protein ComEC/Rec2 [Nitrospirota bacterium]